MAGVTADCKECGFPIFDEQTRIGLCDECAKLDPLDRISGRKEKDRLEKERNEQLVAAARRNRELTEMRQMLERQVAAQRQNERNERLLEENERLQAEVKELRRKLSSSEIEDDEVTEVKSFLRKFDNLNLEGEI